jgi:oxaloacetate decarboxylase beta subunit
MSLEGLLPDLFQGLLAFTPGNAVMIGAGALLIFLGVVKEYEPVLLLPIGFGCILANIPLTGLDEPGGLFAVLYDAGIRAELFPLLIFVGVGAMIDFSPLLAQPRLALLVCGAVRDLRHTDPGDCSWAFRSTSAALRSA